MVIHIDDIKMNIGLNMLTFDCLMFKCTTNYNDSTFNLLVELLSKTHVIVFIYDKCDFYELKNVIISDISVIDNIIYFILESEYVMFSNSKLELRKLKLKRIL